MRNARRSLAALLTLVTSLALAPAAGAITYRNPAQPLTAGQVALGAFVEQIERDTETPGSGSRDTGFHVVGLSADFGLSSGGAVSISAGAARFKPGPGRRGCPSGTCLDGMETGLVYRHNLSAAGGTAGAPLFSTVHLGWLAGAHRGQVDAAGTELDYTRADLAFGVATPLGGPLSLYGGIAASDIQGTRTSELSERETQVDAESNGGLFAGVELAVAGHLLAGVELHGGSDMGPAAYAAWRF